MCLIQCALSINAVEDVEDVPVPFKIVALVDTGSSLSIISKRVVQCVLSKKNYIASYEVENRSLPIVESIQGHLLKLITSCTARIELKNQEFRVCALVADDISVDLVLGVDFLKAYHADVNIGESKLVLRGTESDIVVPIEEYKCDVVSTTEEAPAVRSVEPTSQQECIVKEMTLSEGSAEDGEDGVEDYLMRTCPWGNASCSAGLIGENLEDEKGVEEGIAKAVEEAKLPTDQSRRLRELLLRKRKAFSTVPVPIEQGVAQHPIELVEAEERIVPIVERQNDLSMAELEVMWAAIDQMERLRIIQKSTSPWSFRPVLADKRDGTKRFCVNYRGLNAITKKDAYPLPLIDNLIHQVGSSQWFSALDVLSAYWQVNIPAEYRHLTAFSVQGRGHYEFCVMPFGLTNAPATFQRAMDTIFMPFLNLFLLVYIDDILVHNRTFDDHLSKLELVLETCIQHNVRLKLGKCQFARRHISFLGFRVDGATIVPDPDRLRAVINLTDPACVSDVRHFLGLVTYYARFIENFAEIAEPLMWLLRKERSKFIWSQSQKCAFLKLKSALTSLPVLGQPVGDRPFQIITDASDVAIAAVLEQDSHPLEYYSKTLTGAERKWCSEEKECFAMLQALKRFRRYVYGRQVTLLTDCKALVYLQNHRDTSTKLGRWSLYFQEYEANIIHRPGAANANVDALSRLPIKGPECAIAFTTASEVCCFTSFPDATKLWDVQELVKAQANDADCMILIKAVSDCELPTDVNARRRTMSLMDNLSMLEIEGKLVLCWVDNRGTHKPMIPKGLQARVLQAAHDSPVSGHYGYVKTYARLKERVFWPRMAADVECYVKNCPVCQVNKARRSELTTGQGLLQPIAESLGSHFK